MPDGGATTEARSLPRRSIEVLVLVAGLTYTGILVLVISVFESPPTTASNPYPVIADVFGAIFLAGAFFVWRRIRWGYPLGLAMSALFFVLFVPDLQDSLTGLADPSTFVQGITLLTALVVSFIYSLLGVRRIWGKTAASKPAKMMRASTAFALIAVGFVVGGAFIGVLGSGVESRLLSTAGKSADVAIVQGASNPNQAQSFSPDNLTVKVGTTVTWINKDTVSHTVTSFGSNLFDSGYLPSGAEFKFTFTTPGTYPYYCTIHTWMRGTIVVTS